VLIGPAVTAISYSTHQDRRHYAPRTAARPRSSFALGWNSHQHQRQHQHRHTNTSTNANANANATAQSALKSSSCLLLSSASCYFSSDPFPLPSISPLLQVLGRSTRPRRPTAAVQPDLGRSTSPWPFYLTVAVLPDLVVLGLLLLLLPRVYADRLLAAVTT
jgi:hypothetical protein